MNTRFGNYHQSSKKLTINGNSAQISGLSIPNKSESKVAKRYSLELGKPIVENENGYWPPEATCRFKETTRVNGKRGEKTIQGSVTLQKNQTNGNYRPSKMAFHPKGKTEEFYVVDLQNPQAVQPYISKKSLKRLLADARKGIRDLNTRIQPLLAEKAANDA